MPCMNRIQAAFDLIWLETSCLGWKTLDKLISYTKRQCFTEESLNLRSISTCKGQGQRSNQWKMPGIDRKWAAFDKCLLETSFHDEIHFSCKFHYISYFPPQRFYLRSMSSFKGQDQQSKCRKMPCMDQIQAAFDSIWLETSCLGWNTLSQ